MKNHVEAGESICYRLKKAKSPIVFMCLFFPIWFYFGVIFLRPFWEVTVSGSLAEKTTEYFIMGLIGLLIFLPVVLIIVISYFLNQLVITDRRVCIRRGLLGSVRIISLRDIRSFRHVCSRSGKSSNNKIWFYLNSGEIVKTGELFITPGSLLELLEHLRRNFEGRGFDRDERRQMRRLGGGIGQPVRETNAAVVLLVWLPLILSVIYTVRFLTM